MRKSVAQQLAALRTRARLSMDQLARDAGYRNASSIQRYLSEDDFRGDALAIKTARKFAKALAGRGEPPITEEEVMALAEDAGGSSGRGIPVVSFVRAGHWTDAEDPYPPGQGELLIPAVARVGPRAFALKVDGTSMLPIYLNGDYIIVDPDVRAEPGDDVIAKLDSGDAASFKRLRQKSPDEIELFPLNDQHPTLFINERSPGKVIGVVVEHHRFPRAGGAK